MDNDLKVLLKLIFAIIVINVVAIALPEKDYNLFLVFALFVFIILGLTKLVDTTTLLLLAIIILLLPGPLTYLAYYLDISFQFLSYAMVGILLIGFVAKKIKGAK